ncbi:MAG: hypothetical protein GFH27_549349n86 [Chloroflexi bacterium AL-W]|nr:hypothetical protein [Chloroflexi bacterium AL-N1]NOK69984.1 hypothetical protein [Chloroflexi bacterium AL-N10]NOK73718.1 hypothetical protein [Chloroflexi bacterium AL-N5]NOK85516.1 hypothetical protein [Chloroflexi bacterium AL-W]NOK91717.1 hypothetical protein [Chloroflexi bacterium AL-N15]
MNHYSIDDLLVRWQRENMTTEQAVGQILQILRTLEQRLRDQNQRLREQIDQLQMLEKPTSEPPPTPKKPTSTTSKRQRRSS